MRFARGLTSWKRTLNSIMMVFMFWATSYTVIRPIIVRLNGILGRCIAVRFVIRPPVWSGIIASLGTQISQLFRAVSESVIRLVIVT